MVPLVWMTAAMACATEPKPTTTPEELSLYNASGKSAELFTTAFATDQRMQAQGTHVFKPAAQPLETEINVFINPNHSFQEFLGMGGAITDASAEVFAQLPEAQQQELLRAYFDPEAGIGYTLARTTIHSCDFSSESYTYVSDEDPELGTFSIEHDRQYRIPLIKQATQAAGGELLLYASPWSPPPFMKTNGQMLQGGSLKEEYYASWALYFAKFIEAYEAEGMPIWGVTIQNEPMATQRWESCIYTAEQERDFLKLHLGPTLEARGLGDKNVVVWDHNRDLITHRAYTIFDDPEARKYAWGIGFHWYETWTGGEPMFDNLGHIQDAYPDKHLLFTEGCQEAFDAARYQGWPKAERYGRSIINDFNQGTVGWTDWNILLDHTGGPNHVQNLCFAPIHADTRTGELIYTPTYYYLGHFSKFIRPGAKRVSATSSRSPLLTTAWQNTDGSLVIVVMNQSDADADYRAYVGQEALSGHIPAHAIQTWVVE